MIFLHKMQRAAS